MLAFFLQFDKLGSGCKEIDKLLAGGFLCPGVTEIAGESSSGKTQFCLQSCIVTTILNPDHSKYFVVQLQFSLILFDYVLLTDKFCSFFKTICND